MTLIEGIGDEVIHFFILLAIILIALVAWWSTNISERPFLRTVLILERHATRHTTTDQATLDLRDIDEGALETNEPETEEKTSQSVNDSNNRFEINVIDNIIVNREEIQSTMPEVAFQSGAATSIPSRYQIQHFFGSTSISYFEGEAPKPNCPSKEALEGSGNNNTKNDSSIVRNRRIAFFNNKEESAEDDSQTKHSKNSTEESSTSNEFEGHSSEEGNIRIRLKYLNDDLKLVEGKLQEQLGDFKRRHFSLELAGRKLVRLIFNGKVLQQDTKTLQNYGFFDNCVVHCLVHQPRTPPPSPNLNRSRSDATAQNETVHHWDLGNILFASLSVLLCLAWYGRYQYAQLYTATTTVALIGLTGMFTVSLIGMYMPDVDGIRTH